MSVTIRLTLTNKVFGALFLFARINFRSPEDQIRCFLTGELTEVDLLDGFDDEELYLNLSDREMQYPFDPDVRLDNDHFLSESSKN